jgi:hypothetical protein
MTSHILFWKHAGLGAKWKTHWSPKELWERKIKDVFPRQTHSHRIWHTSGVSASVCYYYMNCNSVSMTGNCFPNFCLFGLTCWHDAPIQMVSAFRSDTMRSSDYFLQPAECITQQSLCQNYNIIPPPLDLDAFVQARWQIAGSSMRMQLRLQWFLSHRALIRWTQNWSGLHIKKEGKNN